MEVARNGDFALCVDLGTGGPKVGLVSLGGEVAWSDFRRVETSHGDGGAATQDAGQWWRLVVDMAREGVASGAVRSDRIVAVCCTGQWASTVPVDAKGDPVAECALWSDSRGAIHVRRAIGGPAAGYKASAALRWIRHSGGAPSTSGGDPVGHILYFENDRSEVAAATHWYLEPVDYLSMCFTGRAAASHASMAAAWLTDNRDLSRLDYDSTLTGMAGIPANKLPALIPTGSVVGKVRDDVASQIGLPSGVEVVTGIPDLHSAVFGSGAVKDYQTHLAVSTSSWISCPVPSKKTDPIRQIATVPGIGTGGYLVANNHESAGVCLEWFRETFGPTLGSADEAFPTFDELTALAATAGAGSGNVIFTPWLAGERCPVDDRCARGGFHNLSLATSKPELVRAVLEGIAYNSKWLFDAVERFTRRRLDPVRIIGGGANSDLWCQVHADVLQRRVEKIAHPTFANLRGAGLFAGVALGKISLDAVADAVEVERIFDPDPRASAVYSELFAEFPKLYAAHKGMFRRLNRKKPG